MISVAMPMSKKILRILGAIIVLLLFLLLVGIHCPIQTLTGFPCPGCNMTTSLYYLVQGNLQASLKYHAMLIPTGIFGLLVLYTKFRHKKKWTERLLWMWIGCMLVYYLYRMFFIFPEPPMVYDTQSFLGRLLSAYM